MPPASASFPVVRRAEMLGELMRLKWSIAVGGTHGKTTTTSMVAALLDGAGLDPTVINGGIINAYGTNARLGDGDWMVVEADESDGSFIKLPATIAVVTNIDPEHMDFYGSEEALHGAFETFVENIPFYGFAVLCIDHPSVQALIGRIEDRRIITYGISPQADYRAENIRVEDGGLTFDVAVTDRSGAQEARLADVKLPMLGQHNAMNALAAVTVARAMGLEGRKHPQGPGRLRRREAPLHPHRRGRRHHRDRRLRAPSGRDLSRAFGGREARPPAAVKRRRRGSAAPLSPAWRDLFEDSSAPASTMPTP